MAQQFNKLQARLEEMEEDQTATQLTRDLQQQVWYWIVASYSNSSW